MAKERKGKAEKVGDASAPLTPAPVSGAGFDDPRPERPPALSPHREERETTTETQSAVLSAAKVARMAGVTPAEVLAWRDHGAFVRVVTVDGRKIDCGRAP